MKKKLYREIYCFLLFSTIASFLLLSSCKNDDDNMRPPVITEVRNYDASPNDTVITTLEAGQWIVLLGKNLDNAKLAFFGSTQATINTTLTTSHSIVVQVPTIPFQSIPRDKINEITLVNKNGIATTFTINITGAPIISHVRNYVESPNDTIVNIVFPGQQINLVGYNLNGATSIAFQGVEADLGIAVYTDTSVVVNVPADLSSSDGSLANRITYTTPLGTVVFPIKIIGPPIIGNISCENPSEGSTVYLKGYNFVSIESLNFGGNEISSFKVTSDSTLEFVVPVLTGSGPATMTTPAGTFTTMFNVNDVETDVIVNYDDISPVGWGGSGATVSSNSTDFPGNNGKYAVLQNDILPAWDWGAWNGGRIMTLDPVKWMSKADTISSLDSWAVKFEMNVPQGTNGITIFIVSEHNDYRISWQPWQISAGKTMPFKTNGWQTITLPLSLFTAGWGGTRPAADIVDLLGHNPESQAFTIQTMNIGSGNSATGLKAAIDNVRIVKVK